MKSKFFSFAWVTLVVAGLALAVGLILNGSPTAVMAQAPDPKQEGIAFTSWWHDEYLSSGSDETLVKIEDTGAEWISLLTTWYQATLTSTDIMSDATKTPTDAAVIHAIESAHDLGLKVMLKPHLDVMTEEWRGEIGEGQFTTEAEWDAWFASYQAFINHYAQLAADNDVDMFCVGTELDKTAVEELRWRDVITGTGGITSIYTGSLVYAANHTYTNTVMFWDAVDYIGIDAYYALATTSTATVDDFKLGWTAPISFLADLADEWDKDIIFTEIGYRSIDGAGMAPWAYEGNPPLDLQEQTDLYQAFFEVVYPQPWLAGVYWWNWEPKPMQGGPCDRGYTVLDKPAEDVLREFFGGGPKEGAGALTPRPNEAMTRDIYIDEELAHAPDWSWGWWYDTWHGGTVVFTATDEVYAGTSSIRADVLAQDWDAAAFGGWGTPANTKDYYWLEFYIKQQNLDHGLQLVFSDGGNTLDYCRYTVEQDDGWSHVRIPFTEANWADKDLTATNFAIQTQGNDTTFWLDNMRVLGAIPVELSDGYAQTAKAGATVTYTHILQNFGATTDTLSIEAMSSRSWPIDFRVGGKDGTYYVGTTYIGPIRMGPGVTTTVQVILTVPPTEMAGVVDTTTVTATSLSQPQYFDTLMDLTTVLPGETFVYLPLVMRGYSAP